MSSDHRTEDLVALESDEAMAKIGACAMQLVDQLRSLYPNGRLGLVGLGVEVHYDVLDGDGSVQATQVELVAFNTDPRNWVSKAFWEAILEGYDGGRR